MKNHVKMAMLMMHQTFTNAFRKSKRTDMKTTEERAKHNLSYERDFLGRNLSDNMVCRAYVKGATEQRAIDIDIIPQLYVRWLMIDGEKPSWVEYANKATEK